MKKAVFVLGFWGLVSWGMASPAPVPVSIQTLARGRNHSAVEAVLQTTSASGQTSLAFSRYVVLSDGLNVQDAAGNWSAARPVLTVNDDGTIRGTGACYSVTLQADLATPGLVDLTTSAGQRFRAHLLSLSYYDPDTGRSQLLGTVTNSVAELSPTNNRVIFRNAFSGAAAADVIYEYGRGRFSQNVLLRESLPAPPAEFGAHTRLEVTSEILELPPATSKVKMLKREPDLVRRAQVAEPDLTDELLLLDEMMLPTGQAFRTEAGESQSPARRIQVGKRLVTVGDRTVLIEAVELSDARTELEQLPARTASHRGFDPVRDGHALPAPLIARSPAGRPAPVRLAQSESLPRGFLMDYEVVSYEEDFTFVSGTTYLIDGYADVVGATFQRGAIVKFPRYATLSVYVRAAGSSTGSSKTVFTASDDDSVGDTYEESTGQPTGRYGNPALKLDSLESNAPLSQFDIRYAYTGIQADAGDGSHTLSNSFFWYCNLGATAANCSLALDTVDLCEVTTWYSGNTTGDNLTACQRDYDADGLPDVWELQYFGNLSHSATEDYDYDGRSNSEEYQDGTNPTLASSANGVRLGYWKFNSSGFVGEEGQEPLEKDSANSYVTPGLPGTGGAAALTPSTGRLRYRDVEANGHANINCRSGTVRFWFKPNWTSADGTGIGGNHDMPLCAVGLETTNIWEFRAIRDGQHLQLWSSANGIRSFPLGNDPFGVPIDWVAGRWYQVALTYTPTNVACYVNGLPLASDGYDSRPAYETNLNVHFEAPAGVIGYPDAPGRATWLWIGSSGNTSEKAGGAIDELETFNYPLSAQEVRRGFPNFAGASTDPMLDTDYDGRSDLLEDYVDSTDKNSASSVVPTRLGYWRFNDASLSGEQGQNPLSSSSVSLSTSWSTTALNLSSSGSRVIYRDVETNGWANLNCREGAVRFWFKPAWSTGTGPSGGNGAFLYLGDEGDYEEVTNMWTLCASDIYIGLVAVTNGVPGDFTAAELFVDAGKWYQIVLNFSATNLAIYQNGECLVDSQRLPYGWPGASVRTNGLVIGNNLEGSMPIDGQLEEFETFNAPLSEAEIAASFETVHRVDNDLNGVADVLEDVALSTNAPFSGYPFTFTGVIEAEQWDKGGDSVGYDAINADNATTDYRVSQLCVTNCDDLGLGFCVDKLRAGEWLAYTLDVRVGQTYWVEPRVAGLGTNGVFWIEFLTNGVSYVTNEFTVPTTGWTNVALKNVALAAGTNVMRVTMRTHGWVGGSGSGGVCKLNYISIYPSWDEGITNYDAGNNVNVTGLVADDNSWTVASNNAAVIRSAIAYFDTLDPTNGATVTLPAGRFYVAQANPIEYLQGAQPNAEDNTAIFVYRSNLEIRGAGKTNTALVAHNRATTILYVGRTPPSPVTPVATNVSHFTLSALTLEGSPHLVAVTNSQGGFTNRWESGSYFPQGWAQWSFAGSLMVCFGPDDPGFWTADIVVTNCLFRNSPVQGITVPWYASNILVRATDFIIRDGTNGSLPYHVDVPFPTTSNGPPTCVGLMARSGGTRNVDVLDCSFNGSPQMTTINGADAADGIIWCQSGGNWFVSRCAITNYGLEAVQFNSGPGAVAQSRFRTLVSAAATCALNNGIESSSYAGPTGQRADWAFSFVGNEVLGGGYGVLDTGNPLKALELAPSSQILVSGNVMSNYPALALSGDYPGAALLLAKGNHVNLSGNTLQQGGMGLDVMAYCTNLFVLRNTFNVSSYRSLQDRGVGGLIQSAQIARNTLGWGVSFHLKVPPTSDLGDGQKYFLLQNSYRDASGGTVSSFLDPLSLPAHFQ